MDSPHVLSAPGRRISIDWSLIAITLVAVALLAATTIRTNTAMAPGHTVQAGGLDLLAAHETLVAFEDFSFGAQGWTSTAARILDGGGPVYGPFAVGAVQKTYALPSDTTQVRLAFDLHLADRGANHRFSVRVNGQSVVEGAAVSDGSNAILTQSGTSGDYTVEILLDRPGDTLLVEVEARPAANTGWTLDNVSVVAMGRTP